MNFKLLLILSLMISPLNTLAAEQAVFKNFGAPGLPRKEIAKRIAWHAGKTVVGGIGVISSMYLLYGWLLKANPSVKSTAITFKDYIQHEDRQIASVVYIPKLKNNCKKLATYLGLWITPLSLSSAYVLHSGVTGLIKELKALRIAH